MAPSLYRIINILWETVPPTGKAGTDQGWRSKLTHFEAAYARYREIFQANCMYQVKPYEGIPKLLEELKNVV